MRQIPFLAVISQTLADHCAPLFVIVIVLVFLFLILFSLCLCVNHAC